MATEYFIYFAYGSNMSLKRLNNPARAPSAAMVATGHIAGRRLVFDKTSRDRSGKCDCELTGDPTDRVYGVVYRISLDDKRALDKAEGKGSGYEECEVEVATPLGQITAKTYYATRKNPGLPVYDWYKRHVLEGAKEAKLPRSTLPRLAQSFQFPISTRKGNPES